MRRLAALLALLLLAGCAEPEAAPVVEQPPPPAPAFEDAEIYGQVYAYANNCAPAGQVCSSSYPAFIGRSNGTQGVRSLHLELAEGLVDDALDWRLTCNGDDNGCRSTLAKGVDTLPFTIDVEGLQLQPDINFYLQLTAPSLAPGADTAISAARGAIEVRGTLHAEVVAALVDFEDEQFLPPVEVAVAIDGKTGPCTPLDPVCNGLVGTSPYYYVTGPEFKGRIVAINLTVTWTAGPLDPELHALVGGYNYCGSCTPSLQREGPSPLAIAAGGVQFEDGLFLQVSQPDPTGAYGTSFPVGFNTSYRIEGTVSVAQPA